MASKEQRNAARIIADSIYKKEDLDGCEEVRFWAIYAMFDSIAEGKTKSVDSQFIFKVTMDALNGTASSGPIHLSQEALIALGSNFGAERENSRSII